MRDIARERWGKGKTIQGDVKGGFVNERRNCKRKLEDRNRGGESQGNRLEQRPLPATRASELPNGGGKNRCVRQKPVAVANGRRKERRKAKKNTAKRSTRAQREKTKGR